MLRAEPTAFAEILGVCNEIKTRISDDGKVLGLSKWNEGVTINWEGEDYR